MEVQLEFRDRAGKAIGLERWQKLNRDNDYYKVARDLIAIPGTIGAVSVATKWTGGGSAQGDHSLFVTQVFAPREIKPIDDIPSATEEEALATHARIVENFQGLADLRTDLLDHGAAPLLISGAL